MNDALQKTIDLAERLVREVNARPLVLNRDRKPDLAVRRAWREGLMPEMFRHEAGAVAANPHLADTLRQALPGACWQLIDVVKKNEIALMECAEYERQMEESENTTDLDAFHGRLPSVLDSAKRLQDAAVAEVEKCVAELRKASLSQGMAQLASIVENEGVVCDTSRRLPILPEAVGQ